MNDTNDHLSSLMEKKRMLEENIKQLTDEMNEKRRKITEVKKMLENTQIAIRAEQFEIISKKLGLSPEEFLEAVDSGNILVDVEEMVSETVPEKSEECVTHDTPDKSNEIQKGMIKQ